MRSQAIHNFGARPQQRGVRIYNATEITIPAYAPVVFDGNANFMGGGPTPFTFEEGTLLDNGEIVYPITKSQDSQLQAAMYGINGRAAVPPQGYGRATLSDFPAPLLIDPDSFPVIANPFTQTPEPGSYQEFLDAGAVTSYTDQNHVLQQYLLAGVSSGSDSTAGEWAPATLYYPDVPLWMPIAWDVNADGSQATDRVLVIAAPAGLQPVYAGAEFATYQLLNFTANDAQQLIGPVQLAMDGLYRLDAQLMVGAPSANTEIAVAIGFDGAGAPNGLSTPFDPNYTLFNLYEASFVARPYWSAGYELWEDSATVSESPPYQDDDQVTVTDGSIRTVSISAYIRGYRGTNIWLAIESTAEITAYCFGGSLSFHRIGPISGAATNANLFQPPGAYAI